MDDPLLTAISEALRTHGVDDPRAVLAAADAAVRVLGRDRCTHSLAVHNAHHLTLVDHCPYCTPAIGAPPPARRMSTVPTQGLL